MSRSSKPWYHAGLRFSCSTCGNCCSGPSGTVFFSEEEGKAMAETLGVTRDEFHRDYVEFVDDRPTLAERKIGPKNYDCVFLDRENRPGAALCKVYSARPAQCRTWPFWPENLHTDRTWYWVKRNTPCPGMDQGRHYSLGEIEARRDAPGTGEGSD